MSRQLWRSVIESKFFYVYTYRRAGTYLLASSFINVLLLFLIMYVHFTAPERSMYATSGITPIVELTPLSSPNTSSEPLLATDIEEEMKVKPIPN
jgi:intracellular multiplication protein IcmM